MKYKTIDDVTYYDLSSKKSYAPVVGLIVLVLLFGLVAGYLGHTFGYAAL